MANRSQEGADRAYTYRYEVALSPALLIGGGECAWDFKGIQRIWVDGVLVYPEPR